MYQYRASINRWYKSYLWQGALDIGIRTADNFNKVLVEIVKHVLPAYAFCNQTRYLCKHLLKSRSMKLHSFVCRLQELYACLAEFPPDAHEQKTELLSKDGIIDIIYQSMSTTWKIRLLKIVSIMQILQSKKWLIFLRSG